MHNDIALLKLSGTIPISPGIVLPTVEVQKAKLNAVGVSGWGTVVEGGQMSDILMGADISLVSNAVCNAEPSYNHRISDSMICAGLWGGGLDSCQGDSGGPATAVINGTRFLIGVESWGEGCARKLKYGVYTRVSSFRPWIDTTFAQN